MRLVRERVESMYLHAEAVYPDECCGLILGPPRAGKDRGERENLSVFPIRNVQNEYHKRDPQTYTRTARRAFLIDPFEFERILQKAKGRNEVLRGIFHSHPDEEAYFSQEDKSAAVPFGDIPSFPEAEHIVMSVRDRQVVDSKVFLWSAAGKDFFEAEFVVIDGDGP